MTSTVDIVNHALLKIRGNTIAAIGEDGAEGEFSEILYEQIRDSVMADHPWNFARGRATLTLLAEAPAFEYDYQYSLPTDCLRVWDVYNSSSPWVIEGGKLLINDSTCSIRYIKKVTTSGLYPPLFVEALATRLAAALCVSINGDASLKDELIKEYIGIIRRAKQADAQEGTPDNLTATTWIDVRGGYGVSDKSFYNVIP